MPYQIKKQVNGNKTVYKLYNIKKKEFVKINFKSKESAVSAGIRYMKYRKENPVLVGNKLLNKSKKK
jgi:hypothetical protein